MEHTWPNLNSIPESITGESPIAADTGEPFVSTSFASEKQPSIPSRAKEPPRPQPTDQNSSKLGAVSGLERDQHIQQHQCPTPQVQQPNSHPDFGYFKAQGQDNTSQDDRFGSQSGDSRGLE